jgi:mitogen-activated protein kinase kinase kinase 7
LGQQKFVVDRVEVVDMIDVHGETALHGAVNNNFEEIARILIEAGADPDLQNFEGKSPKMIAMSKSNGSAWADIFRVASEVRRQKLLHLQDEETKLKELAAYEGCDLVQLIRSNPRFGRDPAVRYEVVVKALKSQFENLEDFRGFLSRRKDTEDFVKTLIIKMKLESAREELELKDFLIDFIDEIFVPISPQKSPSVECNEDTYSGGIKRISWEDIVIDPEEGAMGDGANGYVYRAKYYKTAKRERGIDVAVKIMKSFIFPNPKTFDLLREKTIEEARVLKQINETVHTNCVVKMYGIVEGPFPEAITRIRANCVGIVLEYESGGSLADLIHGRRIASGMKMKEKIRLLLGIAFALAELHDSSRPYFIHGDIKPENILLSDMYRFVKLADFGFTEMKDAIGRSMRMSMLEAATNQKGTLHYNAPELFPSPVDGNFYEPSRSSDMYAFGIVAWELLTGKMPFEDIVSSHILACKVPRGERPDIKALPSDVPRSVRDMIVSLWSHDKSDRLTAAACYSILTHVYSRLCDEEYDIFFSHPWVNKNILRHVYRALNDHGYRVWFDEHDMGYDLKNAMDNGVKKSSILLACVNSKYQDSFSCMRELTAAFDEGNKPIVTIVTQSVDEKWANTDLKRLCSFSDKMYVDISKACNLKDENGDPQKDDKGELLDWEHPTDEMFQMLAKDLRPLFKILDELGIPRSLQVDGLLRRDSMRSSFLTMVLSDDPDSSGGSIGKSASPAYADAGGVQGGGAVAGRSKSLSHGQGSTTRMQSSSTLSISSGSQSAQQLTQQQSNPSTIASSFSSASSNTDI